MLFDFESERFQLRPLTARGQARVLPLGNKDVPPLPLSAALDATNLSEWMPAGLDREVKRRYFDVGKRLREYPLPIYVVEGDDMDVLRDVFDRMNSSGHPLKREDVFHALVGSRIVKGDLAGLETVNSEYRDLGFGRLEPSVIYKAFEAIRGEIVGKSDPHTLNPPQAEKDLQRAALALRGAILFLKSAGVPHVEVLPYELPLVVLARFFARHPRPDPRSLMLLRRWFWRGALGERLGGASGSLQQHVDDVGSDEHDAVQALLGRSGRDDGLTIEEVSSSAFSAAHARGKLVLCALFHAAPRDLVTGDKLVPDDVLRDGLDGVLRPIAPPSTRDFGNTVANRLLGQSRGSKPAKLIVECDDAGALASHTITIGMQRALRVGDVALFLSTRQKQIKEQIECFFATRAEVGRDDSPPVAALASKRAAS